MTATITNLLKLDDINKQLLYLKKMRTSKEATISTEQSKLDIIRDSATQKEDEAAKSDALIVSYEQDIAECDTKMAELRENQVNAKTNKEYLAIINGVEEYKNKKTITETKLKELNEKIDAIKAEANTHKTQLTEAETEFNNSGAKEENEQSIESEGNLQAMYDEARKEVDAKFLEVYERLVKGGNKTPLLPIDPVTRTTPYGNLVNHNQMEQIRTGSLATDHTSSSILYIKDAE